MVIFCLPASGWDWEGWTGREDRGGAGDAMVEGGLDGLHSNFTRYWELVRSFVCHEGKGLTCPTTFCPFFLDRKAGANALSTHPTENKNKSQNQSQFFPTLNPQKIEPKPESPHSQIQR